jgi:fatty acid desaturase
LQDGSYDLSAAPPFGLSDIREAIPKQCWEKNGFKSMAYLAADVAIVTGLAAGAFALNQVTGVMYVLCSVLVLQRCCVRCCSSHKRAGRSA